MIGELTLNNLLKKYNFSNQDIAEVINTNNCILTNGEYHEINLTLDYLINKLKVDKQNIIKCPSIMYLGVENIKENVDFLQQKGIKFSSIASCLHVLSTPYQQLQNTYNYVAANCGIEVINKITSILRVPIEKIVAIESLHIPLKNKSDLITIATGKNSITEIKRIVESAEFKNYPDLFSPTVLAFSNLERIKEIIRSPEFKTHPELFAPQVLVKTSIEEIRTIISSEEFKTHPELFTSQVLAFSSLEKIKEIISSEEFRNYPELFTSTVLAYSSIEKVQEIIKSDEFKAHPELFSSEVLARTSIEKIREIIRSKEFRDYPELFTSQVLARSSIEKIREIIDSPEFKTYPELFTSTVLAFSSLEKIKEIINSPEFKLHPEFFTSEVLAHTSIEKIEAILRSPEFKMYPELFTSTVLAYSSKEKIEEMLRSPEFKAYPELFTSEVLARSNLKKVREILNSAEFKTYRELYTSQVLAHSNQKDLHKLLSLPYWQDEKYRKLLSSSILAKSKAMLEKLPQLFAMAEDFGIDAYLTTSFLFFSPSQNYAIISYLNEHNLPLIIGDKLNPIFGKQPGFLKQRYNLDMKQLIEKYPLATYEKAQTKVNIKK